MALQIVSLALPTAVKLATGVLGKIATALDPDAAAEAKAKKTANDFESMFLEDTLDRLTASGGDEGPLGENGTGGGIYRSMLVKEFAGKIVKSGGVGIADQVYRELMRLQEGDGGGKRV